MARLLARASRACFHNECIVEDVDGVEGYIDTASACDREVKDDTQLVKAFP